jgi:DNA invertase Pin-like site-specific DNA recombinase
MDRLARNPFDSGLILQAQADGKLDRIITSDGVKTANGNDRLMGTFELALATKFIDDLRANVKRGNRARFERGWPNYRPPIGWLNDPATKTVIKDEQRSPLLRQMWDMLLEGQQPKVIARIAREQWGLMTPRRGKTGGKRIGYSTVYRMFTNSYYAGSIDLEDGRHYIGSHEPMVTHEEFERAQGILGRRGRSSYAAHDNVCGLTLRTLPGAALCRTP